MGILTWIVFGLVAGGIAKLLMPGDDPGGCIITMILGIAGAFVGGWIGSMIGWGAVNEFNMKGMALAVAGAAILLLAYRVIRGRKT